MPSQWTRRTVAGAVLLTGIGAAALAAGARTATPLAGSRAPTVTRAAAGAHPAARAFRPAPFRSGVPVLYYYRGVPVVPGSVSNAQAQALVASGIFPPYLQSVGPGRTIPFPGRLLNDFRDRERFLNTLIGGENRLIWGQVDAIFGAARIVTQLTWLSRLLSVLPPGRAAPFLNLYNVLNSRLRFLNLSLALNDRALLIGLKNELYVFNFLGRVAPGSPDVAFYRILILEQRRLIDFIVQETETPFVAPPIRR